jgi:hypothetical protein
MLAVIEAGSAPPTVVLNAMLAGDTESVGFEVRSAEPYAEIGQSEYTAPVDQVAGKDVSVDCELPSLLHEPEARSRKKGVPAVVPKIAIQ